MIRQEWFAFLFVLVWNDIAISSEKAAEFSLEGPNSGGFMPNRDSDWQHLLVAHDYSLLPVCKDRVTTVKFDYATLAINFQPKNRFDILGLSLCRDESREDCYVIEIFGLVSGRLGYFWRKQSRNETGEEQWVPGRKTKLQSSLIKSDVVARKGTWDREVRTVYQFYIESIGNGERVSIQYNGGTAKQQREMSFQIPPGQYPFHTVASYYNDSYIDVEGSIGCPIDKRFTFDAGQVIKVHWKNPFGAMGISLCTDSGQYECYVFELVGISDRKPIYFWRKHSLLEETGEEGWVPGLDIKTTGIVFQKDENAFRFLNNSAWKEDILTIYFKKTYNEKLEVKIITSPRINDTFQPILDLPSNFQYTTILSRATEEGKEVNRADFTTHGPCFYGDKLGFSTPFCKQQILSKEFFNHGDYSNVIFPKLGKAEASVVSEILESKGTRRNLCISIKGMAGPKGGKIRVSAIGASKKINRTEVQIGQLAYNNIFPLDWQQVRMSADLPPELQNVPLKVQLTMDRPNAESFVFLQDAKLCSYDGCGVQTADASPFIAYGKKTSPVKYPWHVVIFNQINATFFDYICGGTLIRSDAVVSAAHCFCDDQGKLRDKSTFKIAAGKRFNSLYVFEPNQQFSNVLKIDIAPRYKGDMSNYIHDIALVGVNFTTSPKVLPACLDWFEKSKFILRPGDVGQVAGWGINEANIQSKELYFASLPFIPFDECVKTVPKTFVGYVTPDKLCAGNINGSSVKKGDSGGGLVFERGGVWYLRGVVSLGVPEELTYSTFTQVSEFMPWIKTILNVTDY